MLKWLILFLAGFFVNSVYAVSGPSQQSPASGSTVSSTTLTWQAPSYLLYTSSPYRVQVDDETGFIQPPKDYPTANTNYTPVLSAGTWYWRVKAKDSGGTWSEWSSTWSFILSASSPSPTPSPSPSPSTTSAFTISNVPSSIDSTQTFTTSVNLELSSYPNTNFYLKGAFRKEGSSNYFGLTKVGSSWIKNGSSFSSQYQITTNSSGSWSGNLEIQPDIMDAGYQGAGEYGFKVGRYTSGGSGPTWSNEVTVKINAKEVEIAEGSISLSGLSTPKSSAILGESKKQEELPEIVYSLEKYKKSSTPSGQKRASSSPQLKVAGGKVPTLFYVTGGIFLFASGGFAVYLFMKRG